MQNAAAFIRKIFITVCVLIFIATLAVLAISILSKNFLWKPLLVLAAADIVCWIIMSVYSRLNKLGKKE